MLNFCKYLGSKKNLKQCKLEKDVKYVKFGNESTKLDVIIELRDYGIELVTAEVGITQKDHDDLKFREDHTALKIELKDMIDNFYDVLHFKKKDLTEIFVMGIQATGMKDVSWFLLIHLNGCMFTFCLN